MPKPVPKTVTLNDVTAANILRLRTGDPDDDGAPRRPAYSRKKLAELLTKATGSTWSDWRIIDLEGKRDEARPPSPATWPDLVAIATVLDVTIFDLVLPHDRHDYLPPTPAGIEDRELLVAITEATADIGTKGVLKYWVRADLNKLGKILFRIPGSMLTVDHLDKTAARGSTDEIAEALAQIKEAQEELQAMFEQLGIDQQKGNEDGIDS